jgi:competence protein ComGC
MENILYRYLIVIIACISLLLGLQVPNFIDQYEKRVDAHLQEVTANLQPFQEIADKFFRGSVDNLIESHFNTDEQAFRDEGKEIENLFQRKKRFEVDLAAMKTSLPMKAVNISLHGDREMIDEVLVQYSYAAPMNQEALVFSASVAFTILFMVELLITLVRIASMEIVGILRRVLSARVNT